MRRPCVLFAIVLAFATIGSGPLRSAPWREVESDLPAHPKLHQGRLANGLRYMLLPNPEPKDRISLRLVVAVGSLHENDDESGLAHFVEHMAFRGTRTHPNGSLTAALQRLGVGLGPDSSAFTYNDHTTYHLQLPDATDATLREGLQVFREFAEEVTFAPELIEIERGVILSELATRDTPEARTLRANIAFLWPDSRPVRRPIGGTAAAIESFTRAQFISFYDAWYRPERMAVVIVGNITPARAVPLIERELGRIAGRGPPRTESPDHAPSMASAADVAIHADPALSGVQLTFQHPRLIPPAADTPRMRRADLHAALASAMFQRRLQRIALEPGNSFVAPIAWIEDAFPGWQQAGFSVAGNLTDWRRVAAGTEQEHRRAFLFGFTPGELEEQRRNFTVAYEQAVRSAATHHSEALAGQLVHSLLTGTVFAAAEVRQRDIAEPLARATLADCLEAFRRAWTNHAPHVFVATNPVFAITRAQFAATLNESRATEITAHQDRPDSAAEFLYKDFGAPGKLTREEHIADLDLQLSEFANGVRFNFKATSFTADWVEVRVRIGEGKLSQPAHQPGLDYLANFMVVAGGLHRHPASDLSRVLAGRAVSVAFRVESDACVFTASCARRELALSLQIITAFLTDAAYRFELMRDARTSFHGLHLGLANAPGGAISLQALRDLAGGDPRFGIPTYEELISRNLDQLKAWLEPQFKRSAIEMSVAGDVSWDEARAAVAATLGALPRREARKLSRDDTVHSPPPELPLKVFQVDSSLKQCAIAWYWPVGTVADIREERRCRLLAQVLDDRMRVRVREELGAAYSVAAGFEETRGFPHLNYFVVYTEVPPAHARATMNIIRRETAALVRKGIEPDEFMRAKLPLVRSREDDLRSNAYWGGTVLADAQQYPARLAAARDRSSDTLAITAEELSRLARRHLQPDGIFRFATVPAAAPDRHAGPGSN